MREIVGRLRLLCTWLVAIGPSIAPASEGEGPPPTARPAAPSRDDLRRFVAERNAFAVALLRALLKPADPGNVVLAPHGLSETMAIARAGASGETAGQIDGALKFGQPADVLATAFDRLDPSRSPDRLTLGATLESHEGYGVKVTDVPDGSSAGRAGLGPGDLIFAVDDQPVRARPRLLERLDRSDGVVKLQTYDARTGRVVDREAVLDGESAPGDAGPPFATARAVWVQAGAATSPAFREAAEARHRAHLGEADFREDLPGARSAIDAWFAEATGRPDARALADGDLEPDTRLVMLDAVTFRGRWTTPFPPASPGTFRPADGEPIDVPTMRRTGQVLHARDDEFDAAELPYDRGGLAMLVLLPRRPMRLDEIAGLASAERIAALTAALKPRKVEVEIPKFEVRRKLRLEEALSSLGMPRAFSREAEFPGIDPKDPLRLSVVRQDASLDVDEAGTRAEATTVGTGVLIKGGESPPLPFHADHPFLFLIREYRTGLILFLGGFSRP